MLWIKLTRDLTELLFTPRNIQMATRRDILFKEAIYRLQERERLGLPTADMYADLH